MPTSLRAAFAMPTSLRKLPWSQPKPRNSASSFQRLTRVRRGPGGAGAIPNSLPKLLASFTENNCSQLSNRSFKQIYSNRASYGGLDEQTYGWQQFPQRSRYAFAMDHMHGEIYKRRGLLTSARKEIKNNTEILALMKALFLLKKDCYLSI